MTTIQIPKSRRGAEALRRQLPKLTRAQVAQVREQVAGVRGQLAHLGALLDRYVESDDMDAALALFVSTGLHRIG